MTEHIPEYDKNGVQVLGTIEAPAVRRDKVGTYVLWRNDGCWEGWNIAVEGTSEIILDFITSGCWPGLTVDRVVEGCDWRLTQVVSIEVLC